MALSFPFPFPFPFVAALYVYTGIHPFHPTITEVIGASADIKSICHDKSVPLQYGSIYTIYPIYDQLLPSCWNTVPVHTEDWAAAAKATPMKPSQSGAASGMDINYHAVHEALQLLH